MDEMSGYSIDSTNCPEPLLAHAGRHSIIATTIHGDAINSIVLKNYEFEAPVTCDLYRRNRNDTYLVTSGNRRFALKLYAPIWEEPAISKQLYILQRLSERGVGVALPVVRSDGQLTTSVHAPEGPRVAVLFEWMTGTPPKLTNSDHAERYGSALARMHNVGDALNGSDNWPKLDAESIFEIPFKRIRPRLSFIPGGAARLDAFEMRMERQLRSAQAKGLDRGLCHGDIWAGNARIDANSLTMFDFDYWALGWRLYDVASFRLEARMLGIEQQAWNPFLEGYTRTRPDASSSSDQLGMFMILRYLWTVSETISLSSARGIELVSEEFFGDVLPFCEKMEQELIQTH